MRSTTPLMVMLSLWLLACGDDDGSGALPVVDAGEVPDSGEPSGMDGSMGGSSGGGGGGSGGTGAIPMTGVECGDATCTAPGIPGGFVEACCVDEATSTCGTSVMGSPCAEPPEGDLRCPEVDFGGFLTLASCCTDDGLCGVDASAFGMPCVDLATAAERAEEMGGIAADSFPEPRSCDDTDAGMMDDGGVVDTDAGDDSDAGD